MIASEMDGDLVMMDIEQGQYFGVGGVGTRIWELLGQPITVAGIADAICQEFDVSRDDCLKDVLQFGTQLLTHKIIRVC